LYKKDKEGPFIIEAAELAKKEFGENISLYPTLKIPSGEFVAIAIIIDRGKYLEGEIGNFLVKKVHNHALHKQLTLTSYEFTSFYEKWNISLIRSKYVSYSYFN
jgi:hypothetical protein